MMGNLVRMVRSSILLLMAALLLGLTACSGSGNENASSFTERGVESDSNAMDKLSRTDSYQTKSLLTANTANEAPSESSGAVAVKGAYSSSASPSTALGGIGPIADANAGYGRKVIYRASLVMKVENFKTVEEELLNLIHLGGAYVLQFSDSRNKDEVGATYVIKVPSEGFSPFLEKLQKIKSLKFEREVEGSDVTEEFVDLDARLKAKQVVESRMLGFMDKATKTDDLVKFSNQLAQIQEEIEQIKGRIRFLDQNVSFSTINLRLYQPTGLTEIAEEKTDNGKSFGQRLSDALSGSTKALRQFGEGLVVVVAAILPLIIVVAVIGIPTFYFVRKRKATMRETSEERRKAWNRRDITLNEAGSEVPETSADNKMHSEEQEPKVEDR
ncbi:DUF4349 domain-containing protein [Cohnella abietis]|uniref:DUF4349 domain-containing protein n=1 Tax=Cohnella abietis TaxID=2507935 RepID=A0A3T1D9D3_9BACL|nr:DUF4349 domain-containing protein [Cohnella abietis]BBI34684.1 hypothetical protein KCTCHS21_40830 [Cohnella abietis]